MTRQQRYDESTVKTLSSVEHIRLRPGMYIGRIGDGSHMDDGIYILLKEIIDNSIDEYIMGYGKRIDVEANEKQAIIRDYGRGIPLGKVIDCVTIINTGAKFNDDVFQFSVGLNGVGTKAVNALSEYFEVIVYREGRYKRAYFRSGFLEAEEQGESEEANGSKIIFIPDSSLFPTNYRFEPAFIQSRLWNYAYLNSGLSLYYNGNKIMSRKGLYDLIREKLNGDAIYEIIHYKKQTVEFAFCHMANLGETYFSFVNGQYTYDGGTHQSAFREGILKGMNEYARKSFNGDDVRNGIVGAISIRLREPIFESQTKNKLGNVDIRADLVNEIKNALSHYLHRHQETADRFLEKISQNEKLRKEIQAIRKASKEKAKKISLKIPKLRDCRYHLHDGSIQGANSMLFLTEGESAAGSLVSCRDVYTQAIFALKGKPLNCFGKSRELVISNDEFYYIMKALNIEDTLQRLRYEKVIIATDADDDGMHIRNLLLTFFLYYFKELILAGHLFILETPLFRVRNKKQTRYCYSDSERDEALNDLSGKCEITRFKGLGEISPYEFRQFIGKNMHLEPVRIDAIDAIPEILRFFMGQNTPARRDYIMKNLI